MNIKRIKKERGESVELCSGEITAVPERSRVSRAKTFCFRESLAIADAQLQRQSRGWEQKGRRVDDESRDDVVDASRRRDRDRAQDDDDDEEEDHPALFLSLFPCPLVPPS